MSDFGLLSQELDAAAAAEELLGKPNVAALLRRRARSAARLEAEVAAQKETAELAAAICLKCTGNPIEAATIVFAQARAKAAAQDSEGAPGE